MAIEDPMELTLGPVLFNWPTKVWRDFYFRIADDAPVRTVVIGEIVCSKRMPFLEDAMPEVIERLTHGGKHVILGSLALVTLERERKSMDDLVHNGSLPVEVNDVSCLAKLRSSPYTIGPYVQVYNEATAQYLAHRGATRICLPPEVPAESIQAICAAVPSVAFEVLAFGRMPLAVSARCYHARAAGFTKDNCRFVCERDPDGLSVTAIDGAPFVAVNGVQTLSHTYMNLVRDLDQLRRIGVRAVRLSPQSCDMVAIAKVFRAVLDGQLDRDAGAGQIERIAPSASFCNGFLSGDAGSKLVANEGKTLRHG